MKKAVVGASFVLGLLQNGTLVTWRMNDEQQATLYPCCTTDVSDIAVGTNFALVLKRGKVYGWGANNLGQLHIPVNAKTNITAIAAGYAHDLAITSTGSVIAWGENSYRQTDVPRTAKDIIQVAGGQYHSLALTRAGEVIGWGDNRVGQAQWQTAHGTARLIAAGLDHSRAILGRDSRCMGE